jgi:GNAT superfamily N-acetyltransferase
MMEQAGLQDVEEVVAVISRTNREAYRGIIPRDLFREPILSREALLQDWKRMSFWVYRIERVVGVAALCQEDAERGSVRWVYVLPEHQRKGIGSALLTFLEDKARAIGLRRLRLRTIERAYWAVAFYQKLGYRLVDRIQMPWGFDVFMEKDLVRREPCTSAPR